MCTDKSMVTAEHFVGWQAMFWLVVCVRDICAKKFIAWPRNLNLLVWKPVDSFAVPPATFSHSSDVAPVAWLKTKKFAGPSY